MSENYPSAPQYEGALSILGAQLSPVSVDELHRYIGEVIEQRQRALILHLNVHCVNLCQKYRWFKDFINQAHLVFCDGDGVRWGAKMLGLSAPPKITYDRWIWQLAELADKNGYRVYFLGGEPGVAAAAAERIGQRFPQLKFVGTQHGYFDKSGSENEQAIAAINEARPDILVLGFGMPIQEQWLRDNWQQIEAHVMLTGGAVFDYASGRARRAPAWMIRLNLEWLYRFSQEPKRLFKRYLWGNPYFMWKIMQAKWLPRRSVR
ncbi:MAG: WecB/TagA/CpsF family glycosyltransferase [Pirellulales bacterium]